MTRVWLPLLVGLALALALPLPSAAARIQRLEAVGIVPVDSSARKSSPPRDAAIQAALREAVQRVAIGLLEAEDAQAVLEEDPGALPKALGKKMLPYTARFRILEDRGERPALFLEDPNYATEYQVIVGVEVDVDRVRAQLVGAGLLAAEPAGTALGGVLIDVRGVRAYPAFLALRSLLIEGVGASRVLPVEFSRQRVVLEVVGDKPELELLFAMQSAAPPTLEIVALESTSDLLTVGLRWKPGAVAEVDEDYWPGPLPQDADEGGGRDPAPGVTREW